MTEPLQPLDYATPGDDNLITIGRMGVHEAEMAAAKLRSEDIDCFIADSNVASTYQLVMPDVRLQVRARDVARAREVLDAPAPETAEGDYVDETWRCPKCHRKTVEHLPLPPLWRLLRNAFWLTLLVPPIAVGHVRLILPAEESHRLSSLNALVCPWAALVLGLSLPLILRDRGKHCTTCKHAWNAKGPLPATPPA